MTAAPEESDGRKRRALESRRKIAAAMIDLLREGAIDPSAEDVAARAGVGRRTVFRLFEDMESLYLEMQALMFRRVDPYISAPFEGATWRARMDEMIERRAAIFEEILPVKSAADLRRPHSPFLQASHRELTRNLREMLRVAMSASMFAERELLDAVDLALSFDTWKRLRNEQRLSAKAARAVVARLVSALVD